MTNNSKKYDKRDHVIPYDKRSLAIFFQDKYKNLLIIDDILEVYKLINMFNENLQNKKLNKMIIIVGSMGFNNIMLKIVEGVFIHLQGFVFQPAESNPKPLFKLRQFTYTQIEEQRYFETSKDLRAQEGTYQYPDEIYQKIKAGERIDDLDVSSKIPGGKPWMTSQLIKDVYPKLKVLLSGLLVSKNERNIIICNTKSNYGVNLISTILTYQSLNHLVINSNTSENEIERASILISADIPIFDIKNINNVHFIDVPTTDFFLKSMDHFSKWHLNPRVKEVFFIFYVGSLKRNEKSDDATKYDMISFKHLSNITAYNHLIHDLPKIRYSPKNRGLVI